MATPRTHAARNTGCVLEQNDPQLTKLGVVLFCVCAPSRARTLDRLLKRELLYQLS